MLPLAASTIPNSAETIAEALTAGLAAHGVAAREVTARGAWPRLDLLRLDLTGLQISRSLRFPTTGEAACGEFAAASLELTAAPAEFESVPIHIALRADGAEFEFAPAAADTWALTLKRATHGEVALEITRLNLERLLHSLAAEAAREHGVEIKKTAVSVTGRGPQAASLIAEVTAKMFIATATVKISGDVDLDEHLVARLSNLQFHGDGMVGSLAGAVIRPQLARLEGRTFPLMEFALGGISLRNVELAAGDPLRLSAQFGS